MAKGAANCTALNSDHLSIPAQTPIGWRDSPRLYGRAALAGHASIYRVAGQADIGPHSSLGFLILIVTLARLGWAWVNHKQRAPHPPGLGGRLARLVHITFYALLPIPQVAGHQQSRLGGAGDRLHQSGPFLLPFGPRAPSSSSGISPRAFDCPRSRLHRNQSQWRAEP